jgi:predicted DNA-binding transcriptional regulator AlpA
MTTRLVSEKEAAELVGLDLATFRAWVAASKLPKPIPDCGKWDLKAIDAALDKVSGLGSPSSALDAWRITRARST